MSRRTAVVFDLDGTLTDTERLWDEVRRGLAEQDGRPWPAAATRAMMGMSTPEWSAYLVQSVGLRCTPAEAARRTVDGLVERYRDGIPLLPGAVAAVRRMAGRGPLGLASSSPRRLIETALEVMGVRELFAAVRSTEEGAGRGKPAPDAFLWVTEQLGVAPGDTVAVEDSTNGLLAALAAGLKVVAIPPAFHPPPSSVLARADAVLGSLEELTADLVAGLVGAD